MGRCDIHCMCVAPSAVPITSSISGLVLWIYVPKPYLQDAIRHTCGQLTTDQLTVKLGFWGSWSVLTFSSHVEHL